MKLTILVIGPNGEVINMIDCNTSTVGTHVEELCQIFFEELEDGDHSIRVVGRN